MRVKIPSRGNPQTDLPLCKEIAGFCIADWEKEAREKKRPKCLTCRYKYVKTRGESQKECLMCLLKL